jgi:hypothetical protein
MQIHCSIAECLKMNIGRIQTSPDIPKSAVRLALNESAICDQPSAM